MVTYSNFVSFRVGYNRRGVVRVALDVPGRRYNVFSESVMEEFEELVDRLETDPAVRLILFTSGKDTGFLAGADIGAIQSIGAGRTAREIAAAGQQLFDRIELMPAPTVAVIHGPCLGGGLEFALACRYRLALDEPRTRFGMPEVQLGLLPAWSGTQRLPAAVGLKPALEMILSGRKVSAGEAARLGLVDLASGPHRFRSDVRRFVSDRLQRRPFVPRRVGLLEKLRDRTRWGRIFVLRAARRKIASRARHYPALSAALEAVESGVWQTRAEGQALERKAFADLLFSPTCPNLIELFFKHERARNPRTWTRTEEGISEPIRRVAVCGAGVMGAGIAQVAAYQGLEVVLNDLNEELLAGGMRRIRGLMNRAVSKGRLSAGEASARLDRITPAVDCTSVDDVDLFIEAATEREDVKERIFRAWDGRLPAGALLVSNTSSLSIGHLGAATGRPAQVAGLHFFNPVHRMPLVEVVRAEGTSEETVGRLVEFVRRLGKTPVVVADRPGFLVNRILFPYLDEAVRMFSEGISAEQIDTHTRRFGMPMGPMELLDQVGLDVAQGVAWTLSPLASDSSPTAVQFDGMVRHGWLGKKCGVGFYRYRKGRRGKVNGDVWQAVGVLSPVTVTAAERPGLGEPSEIVPRLIHRMINEAARCLEERIVPEAWMVDLAMVEGTGFAPFRGGPLRLANDCGVLHIVRYLERLQETYGSRFAPCGLLREMLDAGAHFYPEAYEETWRAAARART